MHVLYLIGTAEILFDNYDNYDMDMTFNSSQNAFITCKM